jgi:hypothetical protein
LVRAQAHALERQCPVEIAKFVYVRRGQLQKMRAGPGLVRVLKELRYPSAAVESLFTVVSDSSKRVSNTQTAQFQTSLNL